MPLFTSRSSQDAERVAEGLCSQSGGEITTGIYHAEIDDKAKEKLHENWLMGKVKVVCATTGNAPLFPHLFLWRVVRQKLTQSFCAAFGLGVNKANVRFVLHHSVRPIFSGPTKALRLTMSFQDACTFVHYVLDQKISLIVFSLEIARDVLSRVWPCGT